jgi:hypothetical protein
MTKNENYADIKIKKPETEKSVSVLFCSLAGPKEQPIIN